MDYLKKEIRIFQKQHMVSDQFYIDDDYNVPDAKRDVGQIIVSTGEIQIEETKKVESYLKVTGKLAFKILYMSDEAVPQLASLDGRIPFEEMIYMEREPTGNLILQAQKTDLTVTVIHSRKLNLKTLAEIGVSTEKCEQKDITMDREGEEPVFKKTKEVEILKVFATG